MVAQTWHKPGVKLYLDERINAHINVQVILAATAPILMALSGHFTLLDGLSVLWHHNADISISITPMGTEL